MKEQKMISMLGLRQDGPIHKMDELLAGRYQILKYLARGGFGQTFLAKDIYLPSQPLCVVKKLKPQFTDPDTLTIAKRLFDREAEILYKLGTHDQIPCLLANFEQDGEFYLVQDFIDGHTLDKEIIPGNRASEAYTIQLLREILQVLSYVHENRVIHRDIKPANLIRRRKDNKIVLIDFGAVKEVSALAIDGYGESIMTVAIGSPGYMPNEQQAFKPRLSSDIYALGLIGIQAVTGLTPHQLEPDCERGEIFSADLSSCISISRNLAEILEKMVRYDYRQRYKSAREALQVLNQVFSQQFQPHLGKTTNIDLASKEKPKNISRTNRKYLEENTKYEIEENTFLSSDIIERCQQELTLYVGPVARFIFNDIIIKHPQINSQQLIEILASEIPEIPQQGLRSLEKLIDKELADRKRISTSVSVVNRLKEAGTIPENKLTTETNNSSLNPQIIDRCQQELANYIGPFANFIVPEILTENPQISLQKLIEKLATLIPNPAQGEEFKKNLS